MPRRKRTLSARKELSRRGNKARVMQSQGEGTMQPSKTETSGSEYVPTPVKKTRTYQPMDPVFEEESVRDYFTENCFFIAEKIAQDSFAEDVCRQRACATQGCRGVLVPSRVERVSLGGGAKIFYTCSGCEEGDIHFNSSTFVLESRRSVVALSVAVAFILSGNTHAGYHKTLARGLGIPVLTRKRYYDVIKILYAPVKEILDDICTLAKKEMQALPDQLVGSWKNAVTTADGCWLTRGHFSQNFTFVIKHYLSNALLYYGHLCMRGDDDVVDEPLFPGLLSQQKATWQGISLKEPRMKDVMSLSISKTVIPLLQRLSKRCLQMCRSCIAQGMLEERIATASSISKGVNHSLQHTNVSMQLCTLRLKP